MNQELGLIVFVSLVSPSDHFPFTIQGYVNAHGQANFDRLSRKEKDHLQGLDGKKCHVSHKLGLEIETTAGRFEAQAPHTPNRSDIPDSCFGSHMLHLLLEWYITKTDKVQWYHPIRGTNHWR